MQFTFTQQTPLCVATEFCNLYYTRASIGINLIIDLFQSDTTCTIQNQELKGSCNLLLNLTNQGIARYQYYELSITPQILSNNHMIINTCGIMRGVGFWQQMTELIRFNEVFVIEYDGISWKIKNYMIKTLL